MDDGTIYGELGVPTVVDASGTKTRIGGSRIRAEALDATTRAADAFVRLADLQAAARTDSTIDVVDTFGRSDAQINAAVEFDTLPSG